ncbi:hypothetical protein GS456_01045 [Rhodococcus hoagii]|nr:hypothetical protein [Prescottella equi]
MLPTRVAIDSREALDSHLERVALANDLTTKDLFRMLTEERNASSPSAAFMLVRPSREIVDRIVDLTGLTPSAVENLTLARYDGGTPLNLDGFNPLDQASYRTIASRGWFPQHGTQACPLCLSDGGIWQLSWKLPSSVVCPEHGTYLVAECAGCGHCFRSRRHSPFRPRLDINQPCGNPLGSSAHCRHSVLAEKVTPASEGALRAARRVTNAVNGGETRVLDGTLAPAAYLAELKSLTTLLLHLASRAHPQQFADWAGELQAEAAVRTTERRGPRWGIQPPTSPVTRGQALAEADSILSNPDRVGAVARLTEWFDLIPSAPGGPRGWIVNRTAMSPVLAWLAIQVLSAHRHVGLQLDHQATAIKLPLSAIPQLLDERTYRRHFVRMLATQESTGRLYASLCIARAQQPGSTWSAAAASIGLDPDIGRRTSRPASTRLLVSPSEFAAASRTAAAELPRRRNYRALERRVHELARSPDIWFAGWARIAHPRRRAAAFPYAVTWMWCEVAQGCLDTSPAWPQPVTRQAKAAYRVFRDALPEELKRALRTLARGGSL